MQHNVNESDDVANVSRYTHISVELLPNGYFRLAVDNIVKVTIGIEKQNYLMTLREARIQPGSCRPCYLTQAQDVLCKPSNAKGVQASPTIWSFLGAALAAMLSAMETSYLYFKRTNGSSNIKKTEAQRSSEARHSQVGLINDTSYDVVPLPAVMPVRKGEDDWR